MDAGSHRIYGIVMPLYLFALDDDAPRPDSGERLPNNNSAREWALQIAREVNRNRQPQNPIRIRVFRADGSPLDREVEELALGAVSAMKNRSPDNPGHGTPAGHHDESLFK